jgi:thiamine-monophosphate kinase
MISIALTGEVMEREVVRRDGAVVGDVIVVTGCLGNSFASGWHLDFEPRLKEAQALVRLFHPTAMMDLSDGLAKDLPRLAGASQVGWDLDLAALPLRQGATPEQALREGEDYELLFTLTASAWPALAEHWPTAFPDVLLTKIGRIIPLGIRMPELSGGWDHFAGK